MKLCWWRICPVSQDFREEYKRRTVLDREVYQYVVDNERELSLVYRYADGGEVGGYVELWRRQKDRIDLLFDTAFCLEAMKRRQERKDPLAQTGFRILYETYLLQQFRAALDPNLPPNLSVERSVINISKILMAESDDVVDICTIETTVGRELDHLSEKLRERLPPDSNDAEVALELMKMLSNLGYEGNTQAYYHVENSSILHVLKNKRGNPISLTILCHLILSRLEIETQIIAGLPGHVVLGLGGDRFVDAFSVGHRPDRSLLGLEECQAIAFTFFGVNAWQDEFLRPTTPQAVLGRILNNILNCDQGLQRYKFCSHYLVSEVRRVNRNR